MTRRADKPDTSADIELRECLSDSPRRSFVMIAGAGSGKTTSLIKALDHFGRLNGDQFRRRGQKVACITYTEVAVEEIFSDVERHPLFHVSTIHSFLWELIKPFQNDIRDWVRQRICEKLAELDEAYKNYGPRTHESTRVANRQDAVRLGAQLPKIDAVRSFSYEMKSDYLKGLLGHDDIIRMGPELIEKFPLLGALLAGRFPLVFVDESQDTFPKFVAALKTTERNSKGKLSLGFFGDPMQKIYETGIGDIEEEEGWRRITKSENFRSSSAVLGVINRIRAKGDSVTQVSGISLGGDPPVGDARIFVLPATDRRAHFIDEVRAWMAQRNESPEWIDRSRDSDTKILVIVHQMAARQLGFHSLYVAFNRGAPESFKNGFSQGDGWPLAPFRNTLLPLVDAFQRDNQFDVMSLLRVNCPRLQPDVIKDSGTSLGPTLAELQTQVAELSRLLSREGISSVLNVLDYVRVKRIVDLDQRLLAYLEEHSQRVDTESSSTSGEPTSIGSEKNADATDSAKERSAIRAYFDCPAAEIWNYQTYINDETLYSTQHGVKGAEFQRVLVVLDDEEGKYNLYSYDGFFGIKEPPKKKMSEKDEESARRTVDRTRRLFYVSCSRAIKDLAVILFTPKPEVARVAVLQSGIFPEDCVQVDNDLLTKSARPVNRSTASSITHLDAGQAVMPA